MQQRQDGQNVLDEARPSTPYSIHAANSEQAENGMNQSPDNAQQLNALGVAQRPPPTEPSPDTEKRSIAPSRDGVIGSRLAPQVSIDAHGNTYPEGGRRAWLVVYGAFSGMTASFGLMNSIGTYQAYLSTHQLSNLDEATIGWVFSIYTFLAFFCGIQIGPFFDAKGPRGLVIAGTVFLVGGTFGIAESTSMLIPCWMMYSTMADVAYQNIGISFSPSPSPPAWVQLSFSHLLYHPSSIFS